MSRATMKYNQALETATEHWKYVAPLLTYPKNDTEYNLLVERLDQLLDIVGGNENHPLIGLVDALSNVISSYDENNSYISDAKGIDALKYLMELHQFNQSDLHEIGSQGVVSELLNGKRKLNLRQITILSKLFKVNPSTFIDDNV